MQGRGARASILSARDVTRIVGTERYVGGLLDPRGGSIQPFELAHALAREARQAGAEILVRSPAIGLAQTPDGWKVSCTAGSVRAKQVIVATNGYTSDLAPGLRRSLIPVHSLQIATVQLDGPLQQQILGGEHTVYDSRRLLLYFRKSPDGRVVLGGRGPISPRREPSLSAFRALEATLKGIFPALTGTAIAHRWSGLVCVTPDFLPHYHTPTRDLHVLLGYNGRGVALSIRAGAWLANHISDIKTSVGIPATPIKPIPLHGLRWLGVAAMIQFNRLADAAGF